MTGLKNDVTKDNGSEKKKQEKKYGW